MFAHFQTEDSCAEWVPGVGTDEGAGVRGPEMLRHKRKNHGDREKRPKRDTESRVAEPSSFEADA